MKNLLVSASALLVLAACAGTSQPRQSGNDKSIEPVRQEAAAPAIQVVQTDSIDNTVEAFYRCESPAGNQAVSAMYGIKDGTLVVAQLKINDQVTPGLWRVANDAAGESQNSFYAEGITWITDKATPANVRQTAGKLLLQAQNLDANGTPVGQQNILLKNCTAENRTAGRQPARQRNRRR